MPQFVVLALYKFVPLERVEPLRAALEDVCRAAGVRGTWILAGEGINGTVAGTRAGIDAVRGFLDRQGLLEGAEAKESAAAEMPFLRLKVLHKPEIVTFADHATDPRRRTGVRVPPDAWDALIERDDVKLIDCRNDFEVAVGTFDRAIDPHTASFVEFKEYVARDLDPERDEHVAMFCTGGIRCEKASSFLLARGFRNVYQLEGGILRYLAERDAAQSRFHGECFVFDRRVALQHGLRQGTYRECHGCKAPVGAADRARAEFEDGVSCPQCFAGLSDERRNRLRERRKQVILADARGADHLGAAYPAADDREGQSASKIRKIL